MLPHFKYYKEFFISEGLLSRFVLQHYLNSALMMVVVKEKERKMGREAEAENRTESD